MATGVPWDLVDCHREARKVKRLSIGQQSVCRRACDGQPKRSGKIAGWIQKFGGVAVANKNRQCWPLSSERGISSDVIRVAVRQQNGFRFDLERTDAVDDRLGFKAWIDDEALGLAV